MLLYNRDTNIYTIIRIKNVRKLAVVSRDDCVRISGNGASTKPILRHTGKFLLLFKLLASSWGLVGRGAILVWSMPPFLIKKSLKFYLGNGSCYDDGTNIKQCLRACMLLFGPLLLNGWTDLAIFLC